MLPLLVLNGYLLCGEKRTCCLRREYKLLGKLKQRVSTNFHTLSPYECSIQTWTNLSKEFFILTILAILVNIERNEDRIEKKS